MIKKLAERDLVVHEPYHGVRLTADGERVALETLRHHRLVKLYLCEHLGVPWDRVQEEAEALEHVLSEDLVQRIAAKLGNIVGEKLRRTSKEAQAALARQGRYHQVAGNLRVKQVRVDDGTHRDRFVICHNPDRARRDEQVRQQILTEQTRQIDGCDTLTAAKRQKLYGALATKPAFKRFLRQTATGKLRIDRAAVSTEAKLDGKFLLRTSDESLSAEDIALGYKALYEAERGCRDMKSTIDLRPVYHRREDRIQAHVQLCWLALLLLRVAETETAQTWRNLRNELDRMHLITLATSQGTVAQRTEITHDQQRILKALKLPEPPRFYDFTPEAAATPD